MIRRVADGLAQLRRPGLWRLVRAGVDQIEGEPLKGCGRQPHRRKRLIGAMHATEALEVRIVQSLHAKRHAVDAGGTEIPEALGLDGGWVGLERHLRVRSD